MFSGGGVFDKSQASENIPPIPNYNVIYKRVYFSEVSNFSETSPPREHLEIRSKIVDFSVAPKIIPLAPHFANFSLWPTQISLWPPQTSLWPPGGP